MFCPFIKGECRSDCVFHHNTRTMIGGMTSPVSPCVLAIAADQLDYYASLRVDEIESRNY